MTMPGSRSVPFRNDGFLYPQAALSPDGHWVAYSSNQSGRYEIYVESLFADRLAASELTFVSADARQTAVAATIGMATRDVSS